MITVWAFKAKWNTKTYTWLGVPPNLFTNPDVAEEFIKRLELNRDMYELKEIPVFDAVPSHENGSLFTSENALRWEK